MNPGPTDAAEAAPHAGAAPDEAAIAEPGADDQPAPAVCPACDAAAMQEFCARCGERRLDADDHSMRRFAGHAVETLTSVDSRLWRTLHALTLRPGLLAAEHFDGVRRPYLGPLQIFLLCNLAFFLLQSIAPLGVFTLPLQNMLQHLGGALQAYPAPGGGTFGEFMRDAEAFTPYADEFRRAAATQARSLIIVMVPPFALLTLAVWRGRHRYYSQHLVFSLHTYAYVMLAWSALGASLHLLSRLSSLVSMELVHALDQHSESILMLGFATLFATYVGVGGWYALGGSRWAAALRAGVLLFGWFTILMLYRMVLFFATVAVL